MAVCKGGRGIKAPWKTTHVRIPEPIKDRVEAMSRAYKEGVLSEPIALDDAVSNAKKILQKKKSARISLENLLTAIYGVDISL